MAQKQCKRCDKSFKALNSLSDHCDECMWVELKCTECSTLFKRRRSQCIAHLIENGNTFYTCSLPCRQRRRGKVNKKNWNFQENKKELKKPYWVEEAGQNLVQLKFPELIPNTEEVWEQVRQKVRDPNFIRLLGMTAEEQ